MAFAILRTEKLKSFGEIGGSLSHNYRTRPTENADPKRTKNNSHSVENENLVMQKIKNRLPKKIRKNGVLCIEYLITASPEWSGFQKGQKQDNELFKTSIEFLEKKHGKENVIATTIHRDETTPHLIAYVVPIDEKGKLNCRKFLGGRQKLSELQTSYHDAVKDFGLKRGVLGSKAEHTSIKAYYAAVNKTVFNTAKEKKLEIKELSRDDQPKYHFLDARVLHGERVMDYVYNDVEQQVEVFNNDVNKAFQENQENQNSLKVKLDKLQENYEKATEKLNSLKVFSDYKELFPARADLLENRLYSETIEYRRLREEEKIKRQQEAQQFEQQQFEARKRAHEQEKLEFNKRVKNIRKQQLESERIFILEHARSASEVQKKSMQRLYKKKQGFQNENAFDLMNSVRKSEPDNYYYQLCSLLFKAKTKSDIESAFEDCEKFLKIMSERKYEIKHHEAETTTKVCEASLNYLDDLLLIAGSEYETQAQNIRELLNDCNKTAEAISYEQIVYEVQKDADLDEYIERKNIRKAEKSVSHTTNYEKQRNNDDDNSYDMR